MRNKIFFCNYFLVLAGTGRGTATYEVSEPFCMQTLKKVGF